MALVEPGTEIAVKNLVKKVSLGGMICAGVLVAIVVIQAVTGSILACASRQDCPIADEARVQAIHSFGAVSVLHIMFGQLSVFAALFMVAFAIVFGIYARAIGALNTPFRWGPLALAVALTLLIIGTVWHGASFAGYLSSKKYWLTPPVGGYSPGTPFAKEQVISSARFTTFVAIHGVVLPFLALVIIMFMVPSFYEFVFTGKREPRKRKQKALKLTGVDE